MIEGGSNGSWKRRRRCTRQFLGEEWISGGSILDMLHHRLRQIGDIRNERANLLTRQWRDIQRHHRMLAQHLFNQAIQRRGICH